MGSRDPPTYKCVNSAGKLVWERAINVPPEGDGGGLTAAVLSDLPTGSSEAGRRNRGCIAILANDTLQEVQKRDPRDHEQENCERQDEGKQLIRHISLLAIHDLG